MKPVIDPFDRLVLAIIAGLVAAIGVVVALGDHVGVPVVYIYPEDGASSPVTATIRVEFGQAVKPDSVEARFSIQPPVAGRITWEANTFYFVPDAPLLPGETYTVTIAPGVEGLDGQGISKPLSWSFTPRLPVVLYLAPVDAIGRSLWLIPADGGTPTEVFSADYGVYDFSPSPDGAQVAMTVYNEDLSADIWLIDASGDNPRRVTDCAPGYCGSPAWSPDGKLLAYERQTIPTTSGAPGPSRVWLYDLTSGQTTPVFEDNQVLGYTPSWSPGGERLALFDANAGAIRVLDLSSGALTLIPSQMGEVGSFSPDGEKMVYVDIRQVGRQFFAQLWLAYIDSEGGVKPLLEQPEEDQSPAWSPDGQWIAFGRRRLDRQGGMGNQLMVFNPATGELRQLTDNRSYNNTGFRWDPTGRFILFQRFDLTVSYARSEVWLYDLETDRLTLLVDGGLSARWLP